MLTSHELQSLQSLREESIDIQCLLKTYVKKSHTAGEYVADTVRDYSRVAKGRILVIQGYAYPYSEEIKSLEEKLESKLKLIAGKVTAIEDKLDEIDDVEIRRIIRLRHVAGLRWEDVAVQMGSTYSADACRKQLDRFVRRLSE